VTIFIGDFSHNLVAEAQNILDTATWENSTIREFLNNEFYNSFSIYDQDRIIQTQIYEEEAFYLQATFNGLFTYDYVFILNQNEVKKYLNEFSRLSLNINGSPSVWWTRTPSSMNKYRIYVNIDQKMQDSMSVRFINGVRPAMWIKL